MERRAPCTSPRCFIFNDTFVGACLLLVETALCFDGDVACCKVHRTRDLVVAVAAAADAVLVRIRAFGALQRKSAALFVDFKPVDVLSLPRAPVNRAG